VFAETGLAGARVETIARQAGCSAGLVYTYFDSKDGLFDAVLHDVVEQAVSGEPMDPADLPAYAAGLYRDATRNPDIGRFAAWHQLQRDADVVHVEVLEATRRKIEILRQAQLRGVISDRLPASTLLLALQAISRMWSLPPAELALAVDPNDDVDKRAAAIADVVAALLER